MPRKKKVYKVSTAVRMDYDSTFTVFTFPAFHKSISGKREVENYIREDLGIIIGKEKRKELFRTCREEGTVMLQGRLQEKE